MPDAPHGPEDTKRGDRKYDQSNDSLKNPEMVGWLVGDPVRVVVQRQPPRRGAGTSLQRFVNTVYLNTDPICRFETQHVPAGTGVPRAHKPTPSRALAMGRNHVEGPGIHAIYENPRRRDGADVVYPLNVLAGGEKDPANNDRAGCYRGDRALNDGSHKRAEH